MGMMTGPNKYELLDIVSDAVCQGFFGTTNGILIQTFLFYLIWL